MQTNVFPQTYKDQVDSIVQGKINAIRGQSNSRVDNINRSRREAPSGGAITLGWFIGGCGGFFVCSGVCTTSGSILSGIITGVFCAAVAIGIGVAINNLFESSYKSHNSKIDSKVSEEKKELDNQIRELRDDARKEYEEYTRQFESNAQAMSVQFAESELAKEVIEWMTAGFCRTIDCVDRGSHVEQITVPFAFNVFYNKITCNLGTYDFNLKRCRNLNSPLEQTALARAIVSAIQLNIMMKYPKDASGTDISIKIGYSYTKEYPATTITYVAPNGNYQAVKEW